jgi:hypothetical protein
MVLSRPVRPRRRGRGKSNRSLELVQAAHAILAEIQPATVRAVCYRLFVAGVIDSMEKKNTSRVSVQLTWAREQGIIPWRWIVDETREAEYVPAWDDPESFARSISRQYRKDYWSQQDVLLEVWSEKGTMRGTLAPVLQKYGVTFRVMHGFTSATSAYDVAQMIEEEARSVTVFYVGDWDPSGLYMSDEDLPNRLAAYGGEPTAFIRLALTESDIKDPELPSFPANSKHKDPRYRWFLNRYGHRCWELDALSPVVLRDRLEEAIRAEIDWDAWRRCEMAEEAETTSLREVLTAWSDTKYGR